MKVLFVTTAFPRWRDDYRAPFIYEAAQAIQKQGVVVKVLAMHSPGAKTREAWDGIEILRPRYLPEQLETLQRESGGLPVAWKQGGLKRFAILPLIFVHALAVLKHSRGVDLIHANWTLSAGCVWLTRWLHRKPFVVTVHGSDIFQAGKIPVIRWLTGVILRRARKTIAVSKALANEVLALGVPEKSLVIIPDGVDMDRFKPPEGDRENVILFVGALTHMKGGDILLRAFRDVAAIFPSYSLVMVGEGTCRSEWEQLASDLGIKNKVTFTGALARDDVADWMRRAILFVLPSRSEGLGVVLLEAMASGTPCIGSDVGGIPDIIDWQSGCLVSSQNPSELAGAINSYLENPVKLIEASKAAREKAEDFFAWNRIGSRLVDQYLISLGKV